MTKPRFFSLRAKVTLAMAFVAALVVVAILGTNFHFRRAQLLQEFQAFVRGVAGTTALALNGDEISAIRNDSDASSPAFQRARKLLDEARRINGLAEQELYILRPLTGGSIFETEFVVMLRRDTFIGHHYMIPPSNSAQFMNAWNSRAPASTDIYRDENGRWISGYAPVFNHAGDPVAIVEADAEISRFIAKQRNELLVGLGAFCVAMIPGLLLAGSITRGLNKLSAGMQRFKSGDHQV